MFKSAEERETERREKEAERARQDAARAEQARQAHETRERPAFMKTPVGAATVAKQESRRFLELHSRGGRPHR